MKQRINADDITRRSFMKKSVLTTGAVTFLSQGVGLAQGSQVSSPRLAIMWEIKSNPQANLITGSLKATAPEAIASLREKITQELRFTNDVTNSGLVNVTGMVRITRVVNLNTTPNSQLTIFVNGNVSVGFTASTTIPVGNVKVTYYE